MHKKANRIFIILISITILFSTNYVFALDNPGAFDPRNQTTEDTPGIIAKAGPVLGLIRNAGIIVAVVALTIIGVKYMFCSVSEKADYKKSMIPYVVGCFFLMGVSMLLMIIEGLNL